MQKYLFLVAFTAMAGSSVKGNGDQSLFYLLKGRSETGASNSCVIPISKPEDIAQARRIIADPTTKPNHAGVRVAKGKDGVNRDYIAPGAPLWSWHATEFIGFADGSIPEADGDVIALEQCFDCYSQVGYVAIFNRYMLVSELGPALELKDESRGTNIVFNWPDISASGAYTTISTNFVYTLEITSSPSSTNWSAVAGGSWPTKTNQWTLPKEATENRFFRVRAQPQP